ncbi:MULTISPECIES: CHAD domain-containing protein [unclassified Streptomyces]|uniref:CHAD domain-containing protein n=1 Tax=unclassified Streptomyces TaxID=2593676 RepID=UPI0033F6D382
MAQQHREMTSTGTGTGVPSGTGGGAGSAGEVLTVYLQEQATEFLRSLRLHRESSADTQGAEESSAAARSLRRAARRISGTLHTFAPLLDADWSSALRPELAWLSGTLAQEHAYALRLERLSGALHRLSGTPEPSGVGVGAGSGAGGSGAGVGPGPSAGAGAGAVSRTGVLAASAVSARRNAWPQATATVPGPGGTGSGGTGSGGTGPGGTGSGGTGSGGPGGPESGAGGGHRGATLRGPAAGTTLRGPAAGTGPRGPAAGATTRGLAVGAAKAAALLERQLTLARTRAHSAALQALGSSRFHAVADSVAVLASEVPVRGTAGHDLRHLAAAAEAALAEAVGALPLGQAGHPYNAGALVHGLGAETAPDAQDAPWLKVRSLLRLHRYAQEVVLGHAPPQPRVLDASHALNVHREAAAAAAAAAQAARTPRIAPATAYALGVLHADQRHDVEAARFAFQQAWPHEEVRAR